MNVSGKGTHYFRDCTFLVNFFFCGNENSVSNWSFRHTMASKLLPCLLLKPLMSPVFLSFSRSFN